MKLKIANVQAQTIVTSYTPLSTTFKIAVEGGSLAQYYYTNANQYIPNRRTAPMLLRPKLHIVDPDGILTNGDVSGGLTVQWYQDNVLISSNSDYTINPDGSLLVSKNTTPTVPVTLSCKATFTDSRSGKQVIFEESVILRSYAKSDENATVTIDKDVACLYNPLKDSKTITVKAELKLGATPVATANAAYWWYIVTGTTERLISDADVEYISGQGTASLVVNAEMISKMQIRVRAQYYEGSKPSIPADMKVYADTTIKWSLPSSVLAKIESPMGDSIRSNMGAMTFRVRMFDNTSEIINPDIYFAIRWYCKSTAAGAVAKEVGSGTIVTIPATMLRNNSGIHTEVYPEIADLGCYYAALDQSNNTLVDESNNILIIR